MQKPGVVRVPSDCYRCAMSESSLQRFHTAQADAEQGYAKALDEIRGAGKRSHWIWYVFPN